MQLDENKWWIAGGEGSLGSSPVSSQVIRAFTWNSSKFFSQPWWVIAEKLVQLWHAHVWLIEFDDRSRFRVEKIRCWGSWRSPPRGQKPPNWSGLQCMSTPGGFLFCILQLDRAFPQHWQIKLTPCLLVLICTLRATAGVLENHRCVSPLL